MPARRSASRVVISFGLIRGLAFAREIRFFTIAAAPSCCSMRLAAYTPAFHAAVRPLAGRGGVYRRPADASFVLVALIAMRRRLPRCASLAERHRAARRRSAPAGARGRYCGSGSSPSALALARFGGGHCTRGGRVPVATADRFHGGVRSPCWH